MRKPWMKLAIRLPLAVALLVIAGTRAYIQFIRDDAPARLTLDGVSGSAASPTTADTAATTATGASGTAASAGVEWVWKVSSGSQAGYRVKEVLFGQSAEAVGRTDDVTGQIEIEGTNVVLGSFTVDMATVASDEGRRDNQFRGRIMDVATYPTSTFRLTEPIRLASLPADGKEVTVSATGDLTLRGTTRQVSVGLAAQRTGSSIRVAGSIPIVFEEWDIPNPSFGPADTEDNGELEFLLVLAR